MLSSNGVKGHIFYSYSHDNNDYDYNDDDDDDDKFIRRNIHYVFFNINARKINLSEISVGLNNQYNEEINLNMDYAGWVTIEIYYTLQLY